MYLMYVDESGDTGLIGSPTGYFALSGLVIHESKWREFVKGMPKHIRLAILRNFLDEMAKMTFLSITNVVVDKAGKAPPYDVFENAWRALFQRLENTLKYGNFPGGHRGDYGLVLTDNTDGKKLQRLMRKMNVYNPIPNMAWAGPGARNIPILRVIEDPHPKDSKDSYFIQGCDTAAYFLMQKFKPNSFVRRAGASNYLTRLVPILNTRASHANALGIVIL